MTGAGSTRGVWQRHPGYVMAWAINTGMALWLGATALLMDPGRFAAPTYDGLRSSFGLAGWGTLLAGYGLMLLVANWLPARATIVLFGIGGALYIACGVYFGLGLGDPHASPWGPVVFGGIGVWQLTQAEAYRQGLPARRWHGAA